MNGFFDILELIGGFIIGMVSRLGLVLVGALALTLPAIAAALVWRSIERRRKRDATIPDGVRMAPNHTWVTPRQDGSLVVGIDEVARRIVPAVSSVELTSPGTTVRRGETIATLRAGARTVQIGSPVDGKITDTNWRAPREPALVGEDPYRAGWLVAISPVDGRWRELSCGRDAHVWLSAENRRLSRMLDKELGIAAADGGVPLEPLAHALGDASFDRVALAFLR